MRILVTGAFGFVGTHIVRTLSREKNEFLILDKTDQCCSLPENFNFEIINYDLADIQSCKDNIKRFNPQACVHLAWEGIPDYSYGVSKKNLDNSLNLIDFIVNETDCKKIVISGSCYEYGKTTGVCKESDQVGMSSFFSWAKYSLYRYCQYVCDKSDVNFVWFRIFYVYGPGQRKECLVPTLIRSLAKREMPAIKEPLNANDFVYVGDVAEAFSKALDAEIESGIYNLGTGTSTKVIDVCKVVEQVVCQTTDLSDQLESEKSGKGSINFWADTEKSQKTLSWIAKVSIESGIREYVKTCKNNLN